ncbi:hypothetical protein [Paenibacillus sp. GbtcB18]|uniref:hypothetical protein n=1 Tax=Paenibacillus sp. GbtcB18 TaxID=2824763 RepID=UPI001C302F2B|nr:hypothetical protein [Paenibacillus sp. GbtcB18]
MSDEVLDKLGVYFEYHRIAEKYLLTFERFVKKNLDGTWEAWMHDQQPEMGSGVRARRKRVETPVLEQKLLQAN